MTSLGYPLYVNGSRHDEPVTISHLPSVAGLASPDGLGATVSVVPYSVPPITPPRMSTLERALPIVRDARQLFGLGADAASPVPTTNGMYMFGPATMVALITLGLVVRGAAGYVAGKAMAPSHDKQSKYAWWGVAAAIVGGTLGLAIEGTVALGQKR